MGEHRGGSGVRGISKGPIFLAVLIVLIVIGVFGWKALGNRINDQGQQAAGTCVEGVRTLDITVDPSIAPQVEELAKRFTRTSPVVRDHCIVTAMNAQSSPAVATALESDTAWDIATLGPRPNLWIPTSTFELAPLAGKAVMNGEPRSLANSPLVLALSPDTATSLRSADAGWKSLRATTLALPVGSPQTVMATQAIAADLAGAGSGPVTDEQAHLGQVTAELSALAIKFQSLTSPPATTADALAALTNNSVGADTVTAVPATEQSIAQSANAAMTAYAPSGATPLADYPAVIVAGGGIDETSSRAAAEFAEFMRLPAQSQIFVDAGFRVNGLSAPNLGALVPAQVTSALAPASAQTAATLDAVVANPVAVRSATILMDTSASMATALPAVAAELEAQLGRSPDASEVALHAFPSGTEPERVLVPGSALVADQRTELAAALTGQRAEGKPSKYPALAAAYQSAVAGYDADRVNSILLVTSSATDESTMTRAQLLSALSAAGNASDPVRIDVLVVGAGNDIATLQDVADRTGGTLIRVDSADSDALPAAVAKLLS